LTEKDIAVLSFIIILAVSILINSEDLFFGFMMFVAVMMVAGTIFNICRDIKHDCKHSKAGIVVWCILTTFTGPIALIISDLFCNEKKKENH
jgi:hypothetical protein